MLLMQAIKSLLLPMIRMRRRLMLKKTLKKDPRLPLQISKQTHHAASDLYFLPTADVLPHSKATRISIPFSGG